MRKREPEPLPTSCLNCGVSLTGRFCSTCGQENEPPILTVGGIWRELWSEFVTIDKKLLQTLVLLFFRPGVLTVEYLAGRRVRYLSPFKLYFWTTALFVLFLYRSFYIEDEDFDRFGRQSAYQIGANMAVVGIELSQGHKVVLDDTPEGKALLVEASNPNLLAAFNDALSLSPRRIPWSLDSRLPASVSEYEEQQSHLAPQEKDNYFQHLLTIKAIRANKNRWDTLRSILYGTLPNILIFAVPLLALLMCLFFWHPRRLYFEHLIFALHNHTFMLLLIALNLGLVQAVSNRLLPEQVVLTGAWLSLALAGIYHIAATRRVYRQGVLATLFKGLFLTSGYGCILSLAVGFGLLLTLLSTLLNL